jgi:excisionase family DNA binding protein
MLAKNGRTSMSPEPTKFSASPDYETKAQVARRLNVSKRTIDNLMRQRRLPFIKLTSKIVRFPKSEVDAYLARNFRIKANGQEPDRQV